MNVAALLGATIRTPASALCCIRPVRCRGLVEHGSMSCQQRLEAAAGGSGWRQRLEAAA